ncbi:MAG TPA: YMGG-like glycine zipper-containing protein [Parasulfuritortus sp.]
MHIPSKLTIPIALAALLAGCATVPTGPSVMALPGSGKTFQQFRMDDAMCRQYALAQIGGKTAAQAGNESFVNSAALGTVVGAAIGAAADGGRGAGVGAASGLAMGSLVGSGEAQSSAYDAQDRYDIAYIQCMYANGERVPVSGMTTEQPANGSGYYPPPPPPDYRPR